MFPRPSSGSHVKRMRSDPKEFPLQRSHTICAAIVLGLWASNATAGCPAGLVPFTVCDISGKDTVLHVCHDHFDVTYSYGVAEAVPQLYHTEPIATVDYHPWDAPAPTSGSITFRNGD